jgi:hypothetical protein
MTPVSNTVPKPVILLVGDPWTIASPSIVHTFASCHPLRDAQVTPSLQDLISTVMARGYEAIHSVHRSY